jgi:site-specific recombinase XerD
MARKRNPENAWMPPYVCKGKSFYEYRPAKLEFIKLAPLTATKAEVWAAYEAIERGTHNTFSNLFKHYLASNAFKELAPRTKLDYQKYSSQLLPVFGHMHPDKIKPEHVRIYMDKRASRVQANREKALLSSVYKFAVERGLAKSNPATLVRKFKEEARDRYVTDAEYKAVYDIAPPHVKAAMEISLRCAARIGDVLKLTEHQLRDDGVYIRQGKTGKRQIKAWSPELRAAITLAHKQPSTIRTTIIIHDVRGQALSYHAFAAHFRAAMDAAIEAGTLQERYHFHDIKAKSISDYEGDKRKFSGHKTERMVAVYDRKIEIVQPLGAEKTK